jgi:hypothetical protein
LTSCCSSVYSTFIPPSLEPSSIFSIFSSLFPFHPFQAHNVVSSLLYSLSKS